MSALRVVTHTGAALHRYVPGIARLRIEIFRAWPYLYDGDAEYEQRYLQTYVDTPDAMVAICFDDDRIVGASTALPLEAETNEIKAPFSRRERSGGTRGRNVPVTMAPPGLHDTLYLGESVLDPACRGQGIGLEFFAQREAHARRLGLDHCVFCAVQRADDDPRRPADFIPLDAFWRKRGYTPLPDCSTTLSWREIGEAQESPKPMQFWHRRIGD